MNRVPLRFFGPGLVAWMFIFGALAPGTVDATPTPFFSTLYTFTSIYGLSPSAKLVQGSDGSFYGSTESGGASGQGTVFKITPSGTLTTLYSFTGSTDGSDPAAALVQGSDGNFYGTTEYGGTAYDGTVFKITPSGTLTTLYGFSGADGASPATKLVQGTDGNFYGTTSGGGSSGVFSYGTVFKITPSGTLTTLHDFTGGADGFRPTSGLAQGTDGNFYGTAGGGGSYNAGLVFKITPSGTFTILHNFTGGTDGFSPVAPLVRGSDGNFYGTTFSGGAFSQGVVFKITPSGMLTTLHSFNGIDGFAPVAALVQGSDGNFYGTTYEGGVSDLGTAFKITPPGTLTTLHSFTGGADGDDPAAPLAQSSDGSFYGTTAFGAEGNGTIFRIDPATDFSLSSFTPGEGPAGSTVTLTGVNLDGVSAVRFHDASAPNFSASDDGTQLFVAVPEGAMKGTITVTTPKGTLTTAAPFRVTYYPVVTSFSPTSGPVGTVVTITGTHLTGITRVRFHEADATVYSSNAAGTQLTVTVPPGAQTGTITLDNRDALAATSSQVFTVTP